MEIFEYEYECYKCEKQFVLEGRLKKHQENQTNISTRKCQYTGCK